MHLMISKTSTVTPLFFFLFDKSRSLPFCVASLKKNMNVGTFWARTSLNSHNVNYILTLFPCCFITYCATRIFQPVHAAKFFEFRILFDKYDVSKVFYWVGSNSYRKPYERECTSGFMSPSRSRLLAQVMF